MRSLVSVEGAVLAGYVVCLVLLLVFSSGQLWLVVLMKRRYPFRSLVVGSGRNSLARLPYVTIQLPIYNERYVIERLLGGVAAIEYPRDRLEVHVLDDSTDVTSRIVAEAVGRLSAAGLTIKHIRRDCRAGFKAGALANGLGHARGELIAIFDADFVPDSDYLLATVPHFADPDVAAVQARWSHLNEHESALTELQALMLDLHFGLEQPARFAGGLFLNFNGTAGIWRRAAIVDAGGWSAATLTEDIDLSYRAQQRGWRLVYLDGYGCPGELPAEMSGLRSQQYRWLKGGAQNARLHLATVARSRLRFAVRWHAVQHLLAGSTYLVILTMVLLSVALAAVKNTSIGVEYVDFGAPFALSTVGLLVAFHSARRPRGVLAQLRFAVAVARFMVFTIGLSVHNSSAVLSGWTGRPSEFVRTPKFGARGWSQSAYTRRTIDAHVVRELVVLALLGAGLMVGWYRREFAMFPIQLMAAAGLTWVIALSMWHPLRARRAMFDETGTARSSGYAPGMASVEEARH
jgi:cellulose synthase/poly-beta-1,6-N-acetylglucosamine synthase-like glycosyltransferase